MRNRIILTIRILAMPTIISGILAVSDVFLPVVEDEAVIQAKEVWHSKGTTYNIQAQGKDNYSESVSHKFYSNAKVGMKLRLSLTRVFKEWKQADLIQNGQVIFVGHGLDIYWMPMMGLFLILPCICYRKTEKWFNAKYLIVFFAAELAGVLLFSKLVLVWLGFIAIM